MKFQINGKPLDDAPQLSPDWGPGSRVIATDAEGNQHEGLVCNFVGHPNGWIIGVLKKDGSTVDAHHTKVRPFSE